MMLAGTLYSYDKNGQRGESLGSFSLDFTYTVPKDQMEAERARLVEKILLDMDTEAKAQAETLSQLPDEMTRLNITQEEYTFNDAQASKDGLLLGVTRVTDGSEAAVFYMDGYRLEAEPISQIFTPDTTRPQLHLMPWEEAQYFGTYESVLKYPWYAPLNELPETVLIAVLRNEGSHRMAKGDDENDPITYSWNEVALLLRINPRTGEVILPKDDAEREAWRAETLRLAADGRNDEHVATLSGLQTINGVTVELKQLLVQPNRRIAYICCEVDGVYYPVQLSACLMNVSINGEQQDSSETKALVSNRSFSAERAKSWVDSNDGWHVNNNWIANQGFGMSLPRDTWKRGFALRLQMDVYDRDEDWNLVFIGSFDISTTVKQEDIASGAYEAIYDLLL